MTPYEAARDWLEAIQQAFAEAVLTDPAAALPSRSYVHTGEVADDCEQLVVTLEEARLGQPGAATGAQQGPQPGRAGQAVSRTIRLGARLTRCIPLPDENGNPPPAAVMDSSAARLASDAWILLLGTVEARRSDALWSKCLDAAVGLVVPVRNADLGGWHMRAEVQL